MEFSPGQVRYILRVLLKYRLLFLILYALLGGLALSGAFVFRFYFDPLPFRYGEMLWQLLPVAVCIKGLAAEGAGLTRSIWKYASFRDVKYVAGAAGLGSVLFVPAALWMTESNVPNGVLLLDGLLTFGLFTGLRFSGRFCLEARTFFAGWRHSGHTRVLVVGDGDRTELALRFLQKGDVKVVGILDADPVNRGRRLQGIPVRGTPEDLAPQLVNLEADEVVLAHSSSDPAEVRRVFSLASAAGAKVTILPEVSPMNGAAHGNPIRELKMSDFLGREPVDLDPTPLRKSLGGARVLVTGAGGSIGSELCRQIARLPVEKLVMLDFSETALFEISEEVRSAESGVGRACAVLCDIRHREELKAVFEEWKPNVVIHAAAFKHVPMMEAHPLDAARTNVLGTRNVVEAAKAAGVKRFLQVSTDKAVEAEGIMGASKAWGERVVHEAGYSCVRFGNVLGSSGSVIPLFEKQWKRSGKLQVTHADATRYFMTIEEAVQLILHAEALGGTGEMYVLDMGEPVRILDMARQMVALKQGAGEETIEITGLRPGERIHEQLHSESEVLKETRVPKIRRIESSKEVGDRRSVFVSRAGRRPERWVVGDALDELERLVEQREVDGVREWLM